ncbi:serine/threonine-protein kinase haspin homolog isoform X2 [Ornithodoros turicata]|uniref:serine/threonine-protein kinase haspin homolog isoform X2 n=1 Tax=Ornithodoros turicata TaxID=34597 RepID=UPI003138A3F0
MLPFVLCSILVAIFAAVTLELARKIPAIAFLPQDNGSKVVLFGRTGIMDPYATDSFQVNYRLLTLLASVTTLYMAMYFVQRRRRLPVPNDHQDDKPAHEDDNGQLFEDVRSQCSKGSSGFDEVDSALEAQDTLETGPILWADSEMCRSTRLHACPSGQSVSSTRSRGRPLRSRTDSGSSSGRPPSSACRITPLLSPTPPVACKGGNRFGNLLSACHQTDPMTFAELFNQIDAHSFKKIADGAHSDIFRVSSYRGDSVIKVVNLEFIANCWDQLFSEIIVAAKVSALRHGVDYNTAGFAELRSVSCVSGCYPEELIKACREFQEKECGQEADDLSAFKESQPFLVWHMSYGGQPMHTFEVSGVLQLWSVIQQVILCIAVAEEAFEFEHRNLFLRHILVKRTDEDTQQFCIRGRSIVINTWGIKAQVIDFAASRIIDGDSAIFTNLDHTLQAPASRNLPFAYKQMGCIVSGKWEAYHSMTNLFFALHVTKELHRMYRHRFETLTDPYEYLAWSEIESRRHQLLDYVCLADFVMDSFKPEPLK